MPQTPYVNSEDRREEKLLPGASSAGAGGQRDVLNHANFGLLPEDKRRFGSFGVAAGVNLALVALLLALTIDQVHEARVHRQEQLVYLAPPPKPDVPPVPKIKMPPIPPLPKEEAKIPPPPKPVIEPPKVELPKVAAKAPAMPAPAPRAVVTPPKPILGAFKSPEAPAQQAPRVAAAQAAGFGAPTGVQANPNANRPSQLAAVGAFGAAANSNQGAASRQGAVATTGFGSGAPSGSPNGSARGAVASTGFGAGSQPAGMPGGRGTVASTGFGAGSQPGGTPGAHGAVASTGFGESHAPAGGPPARAQQPATTPIVVLSKPLPQYTADARDAHIQGDVTLEVRFTADGQVEVLRVVSGLGHGLDEQARVAAGRIHFKPATRDGKAVDQVSVIHVAFQLA
jgi:TonB family protein